MYPPPPPPRATHKKTVAIIGAGPAGITAAYQLSKSADVLVDLYEASDSVGGLSKTFALWDCKVDIGPHGFSANDRKVNELWLEVLGKDYIMLPRLTRIFYKNRFFFYPLKPFNALKNLGVFTAVACVLSYIKEQLFPKKDTGTFEDWVRKRFGNKLYRIFFKTYTEKLWGIACSDLDSDFASQRIKKLSLFAAIMNALLAGRGNKHKSLRDKLAYPKEGTGIVYIRMAEHISKNGGNIFLKSPVKHIHIADGKAQALTLNTGERKYYDIIISSMPLTLLTLGSEGIPQTIKELASKLQFRNTTIVYLKVLATNLFPDNWLYVHTKHLKFGRITNFRNWSPELHQNKPYTILALEYWSYDSDILWQSSDAELIDLAKQELNSTALLELKDGQGKAQITDGFVYRIHRSYPVYKRGYKDILSPIEQYFSTIPNLYCIGRYGSFKYNNQDHSILMGLLAAENILENKAHNLWQINTDYDNYDEGFKGPTLITESLKN